YGDHRDLHSFPTRRSSDLFGEAVGDAGRKIILAAVHGADGFDQRFQRHGFQQITGGTGLDGAVNVVVGGVGAENEDDDGAEFAAEGGGGLDAVHAGQAEVHDDEVG